MHTAGPRYAARRDSIGSPTMMTEAEYPSLGPASAPQLAGASPAKDAPAAGQWASIAAGPQHGAAQQRPQGDWAQADVTDAPCMEQPEGSASYPGTRQSRQQQPQQPQYVRRHHQGQQGTAPLLTAPAASAGKQPGTAPRVAASVHGTADQVAGREPSISSEDEDTVMADLLSGLDVTSDTAASGAISIASAA